MTEHNHEQSGLNSLKLINLTYPLHKDVNCAGMSFDKFAHDAELTDEERATLFNHGMLHLTMISNSLAELLNFFKAQNDIELLSLTHEQKVDMFKEMYADETMNKVLGHLKLGPATDEEIEARVTGIEEALSTFTQGDNNER